MEASIQQQVVILQGVRTQAQNQRLIGEEPLSIRVEGKPYAVVMRTPGAEIAHVAGFCLTEGLIDSPDDIRDIAFCDGADTNVVTVTLNATQRKRIPHLLERRNFISQSSCGLCGKELVQDLRQAITPIHRDIRMSAGVATGCLQNLSTHQPLRQQTRAAHAAVMVDREGKVLAVAEDVGRHNALDKAIGTLFLERRLNEAAAVVMSSRLSYELVQKSARARIPIMLALSRPTALAVNLATELNMTLACLESEAQLDLFCGIERIVV